mgnify:CR=1 FL=1
MTGSRVCWRPPAKLNQLVIVRLGEVTIPHPVAAAPLNVLAVPLGRLKIIIKFYIYLQKYKSIFIDKYYSTYRGKGPRWGGETKTRV